MEQFTREQLKDIKVLVKFIQLYCAAHHDNQEQAALPTEIEEMFKSGVALCPECSAILEHGLLKRSRCPLDPKPSCKRCHIHCYSREYREKIRNIMAYSGKRMILRGRLDYLWHYLT
jgi:uncharacterized paraquat-inducible protein A